MLWSFHLIFSSGGKTNKQTWIMLYVQFWAWIPQLKSRYTDHWRWPKGWWIMHWEGICKMVSPSEFIIGKVATSLCIWWITFVKAFARTARAPPFSLSSSSRNQKRRIVPSISLSGPVIAAFDDLRVEDPDFEFIQGKA